MAQILQGWILLPSAQNPTMPPFRYILEERLIILMKEQKQRLAEKVEYIAEPRDVTGDRALQKIELVPKARPRFLSLGLS